MEKEMIVLNARGISPTTVNLVNTHHVLTETKIQRMASGIHQSMLTEFSRSLTSGGCPELEPKDVEEALLLLIEKSNARINARLESRGHAPIK